MPEADRLLDLSKGVARSAGQRLRRGGGGDLKQYAYARENPREIKAIADLVLEEEILGALRPTGLSILSEEAGVIEGVDASSIRFVVDPLDGTFNFVHGLGPCAVSIALWDGRSPVFGVIYDLEHDRLAWGGPGRGAFEEGRPIAVSKTSSMAVASLCTGFPARFRFKDDDAMREFWATVSAYGKVRMLGSASISLLNVARGAGDVYAERNIMLWDVAAGIAIVAGAGGAFRMRESGERWSYDVVAANAALLASERPERQPASGTPAENLPWA